MHRVPVSCLPKRVDCTAHIACRYLAPRLLLLPECGVGLALKGDPSLLVMATIRVGHWCLALLVEAASFERISLRVDTVDLC
jgi:hypothetical protein